MMRGELGDFVFVHLGRFRISQLAPCIQETVSLTGHLRPMRFNPIRSASYQIGLFGMRPRPLFPSRIIKQTDMISQNALQARDPRLQSVLTNHISLLYDSSE